MSQSTVLTTSAELPKWSAFFCDIVEITLLYISNVSVSPQT